MKTPLRLLFLAVAGLIFSGCTTIPPEALSHATALKKYQKKTTDATLLAFDSSTGTTKFTLEAWKNKSAERDGEYIEACQEASDVFAATKGKLAEVVDLLSLLSETDPAKQSTLVTKVNGKIAALQTELTTRQKSFDTVVGQVKERSKKDSANLSAHARELDGAATKIRALIVSHNDAVQEGIATDETLFRSYLSAQKKMKEVFGPELAGTAESLGKEAGQLTEKYSGLISLLESTLNK